MSVTDEPSPSGPVPDSAELRPSRDELDRLAERVAAAEGRERAGVTSPLTGTTVGEVPLGTADDVATAMEAARRAQREWADLSPRKRAAVLLRYHDLVLDQQDELLDLIQLENGKARIWAFEEIMDQALTARYYGRSAPRLLRPKHRLTAMPGLITATEHRAPKGVVGVISPWNYPLVLSISDALAALVAGNAIVIKPDSQTPFTAIRAFELLEEAGLPEGLVQIVTGPGTEVGSAIIDSADFLMFTGSTDTGRHIGEQIGSRLVDWSAELGGKNPMIITADADLDRAVPGAVVACFANTGQLCISVERIYVDASIEAEFTARFADAVGDLRLGAAQDFSADVGPLASAAQLEKLTDHLRDALDRGARLIVGGDPRPDLGPFFHEPTVVSEVTEDMAMHRDETFGPLVSIAPFSTIDEAVDEANDTPYGLNASVWCGDTRAGRRVAERLRAGTVNINDGYSAAWGAIDSPMGGMGASGMGRRHGSEGLLKYTEVQTIAVRSAAAQNLQDPGEDPQSFITRFTKMLRAAKILPK